jgi:hypothetical protein
MAFLSMSGLLVAVQGSSTDVEDVSHLSRFLHRMIFSAI